MYKSLILISAICCFSAIPQKSGYPYVVVDRFCNCPEMEWKNTEYKLKDIHQSKNDIEIRLNVRTSVSLAQEVITLKNGKYDANLYYKTLRTFRFEYPDSIKKYGQWEKLPFRKFHILSSNLKSACSKLLSYHLDNLPNQNDIDKNHHLNTYFLECKIKNKFSTCYFGAKKEDLIYEYPNVQAFKDYVNIINTFNDLASDYYENAFTVAMKLDHS